MSSTNVMSLEIEGIKYLGYLFCHQRSINDVYMISKSYRNHSSCSQYSLLIDDEANLTKQQDP